MAKIPKATMAFPPLIKWEPDDQCPMCHAKGKYVTCYEAAKDGSTMKYSCSICFGHIFVYDGEVSVSTRIFVE